MAVEQVLQQRRTATLMAADEHRAQQPVERTLAFRRPRGERAEHACFAYDGRRIVGELREQLLSRRRSARACQ